MLNLWRLLSTLLLLLLGALLLRLLLSRPLLLLLLLLLGTLLLSLFLLGSLLLSTLLLGTLLLRLFLLGSLLLSTLLLGTLLLRLFLLASLLLSALLLGTLLLRLFLLGSLLLGLFLLSSLLLGALLLGTLASRRPAADAFLRLRRRSCFGATRLPTAFPLAALFLSGLSALRRSALEAVLRGGRRLRRLARLWSAPALSHCALFLRLSSLGAGSSARTASAFSTRTLLLCSGRTARRRAFESLLSCGRRLRHGLSLRTTLALLECTLFLRLRALRTALRRTRAALARRALLLRRLTALCGPGLGLAFLQRARRNARLNHLHLRRLSRSLGANALHPLGFERTTRLR